MSKTPLGMTQVGGNKEEILTRTDKEGKKMKAKRQIVEIDEEKCDGCGQCIIACAEGALELVDGKAKLVSDVYCDGLGACIGECPQGAITITEREAEEFDEEKVHERLKEMETASKEKAGQPLAESELPCGCPSSVSMSLKSGKSTPASGRGDADVVSRLGHWPIKLQLLAPQAPFLKGSDLILMADCSAASYPNLHRDFLADRAIALGCPKLDDLEAHIEKLTQVLETAKPRSLTVLYMEVPCCRGFVFAARKAAEKAGVDVPIKAIMIGRTGDVLREEEIEYASTA